MANEIYDSTWWGNTIQTASSIGTSTEMIQGQFNLTKIGDELVVNGDFGNGTNNWTPNPNATLTIDNDRLKVTINGASGYPSQSITTEIGKTYRITANSFIGTSSRLALYNTGDGQFRNLYEDGSFDFTITAASTSTQLRLYVYGDGSYGLWDNVSVKEVRAEEVEAVKCLADAIHRIGIQDIQN